MIQLETSIHYEQLLGASRAEWIIDWNTHFVRHNWEDFVRVIMHSGLFELTRHDELGFVWYSECFTSGSAWAYNKYTAIAFKKLLEETFQLAEKQTEWLPR